MKVHARLNDNGTKCGERKRSFLSHLCIKMPSFHQGRPRDKHRWKALQNKTDFPQGCGRGRRRRMSRERRTRRALWRWRTLVRRNETVSFPSFVLDPTSLQGHGGRMTEKFTHGISCVLSWKTCREFWKKSISCLPRTHFPKQNAGSRYSVGVLDEIQMLGDETRGWAWTRTYGKKRTVSSLCILKAIILPRQARDTRRENSKNEIVCFRRAAGPRC